ncbi:regulatory protein RecX [Microbulbifer thermotolerans]|uniref:Regulatory protein RecX n=1 Tax=Microbulbifer thermotolerans TaxID=252514 RepID=A0A143HN47_MICTH|nr:regulatory protein RecX [Microbulbifer thermotolerans]AMX02870.1 RecX family transcriptional regulator [Microbulbifer thermotolerans]MCX2780506.1 recombination regulator RecX [Microbulbifer thermotolerans]MCX2784105.1 recombination regulator RecX [Microbulbifer thermotolerans]MCX2794874.1 recombination regulator RecX [Microbulbifer thermotolerans]MCX2803066.1 recombination regulator RecX [Microbulbifer thermotolerans]
MPATTGTEAANSARALFDAALELLSRREHSRLEIRQKLSGRFPEADFDALFERLHQLNYQSDRRFAEVFTRSKIQRGYGPLRIRRELQQRGIHRDLIGDALEGVQVDWFALAAEQLQRRFHTPVSRALPREQQWKERARRQRFLANRGFSAEAIQWSLDAEGIDLGDSTR